MVIFPDLIEQPTWGGSYIVKYKGWENQPEYTGKKIGQSYELSGNVKLFVDNQKISINDFVVTNPEIILGKSVYKKFGKMPLLIKFTQALGNSFQLHIKPEIKHPHWQPKPESWYFFETGYVSCGIKPGIKTEDYKKTCIEIDKKMKNLSQLLTTKKVNLSEAISTSKILIKQLSPQQFVNVGMVKKETTIDLSSGGIHHSWEENTDICPNGNILYEVQLDVADIDCTIRSFDQGKINNDGRIRQLNIDDYFKFIDNDPEKNNFVQLVEKPKRNNIFNTKYYCLDKITVEEKITDFTNDSFVHLFAKDGGVDIITESGQVGLSKGHGCFLPASVNKYEIINRGKKPSVVLKTYINNY